MSFFAKQSKTVEKILQKTLAKIKKIRYNNKVIFRATILSS